MTACQVLNWSYDRWTRELARFFFDGNYPGEIVAFCADGPTLSTMTGEPEMVAIESLRAAVKPLVMPGFRFEFIGGLSKEWERDGMVGPPPSLPLLALTVLAASLMQRQGDVASHNFYRRFRQQIDPLDDQPGIPGDFGDWVPGLWRQLERWLNDHLSGGSGALVLQSQETLAHNAYSKNIAYPLQQAVFRISDRRHLYRFFRAIGVDPEDDDAEPTELRRALAIWAARHQPGAARLARLATEPSFESYCLDPRPSRARLKQTGGRRPAPRPPGADNPPPQPTPDHPRAEPPDRHPETVPPLSPTDPSLTVASTRADRCIEA